MNELPNMNKNQFLPKSFWDRTEGTTGMIIGAASLFGLGYGVFKALPYIITLLENTLYAGLLGVATFAMVWVLLDKRFWAIADYMYKSLMRKITNIFVTIDPIGILKNYIDDLVASLGSMSKNISSLQGQIRQIKELMAENDRERNNALKLMSQAKKENKTVALTLKSRKAGRLQDSNTTLQQLLTKMEVLYRVLLKMYETSDALIEDMKDEVKVRERERAAISASYSALRSAMKIMSGDPDQKALFDQATEYLAYDYGMKIGEIENFVKMSEGFISSVDLQNGVYEEDAMKMLDEWEKKSESLLLGETKNTIIAQAYDPNDVLDVDKREKVKVPVSAGKSDYGDFFK